MQLIDAARKDSDDYMEAQPLWEYPGIALHTPLAAITLNLRDGLQTVNIEASDSVSLDLPTLKASCKESLKGVRKSVYGHGAAEDNDEQQLYCNGVAAWVDWCYGDNTNVITTGPTQPVVVGQQRMDIHTLKKPNLKPISKLQIANLLLHITIIIKKMCSQNTNIKWQTVYNCAHEQQLFKLAISYVDIHTMPHLIKSREIKATPAYARSSNLPKVVETDGEDIELHDSRQQCNCRRQRGTADTGVLRMTVSQ